MTLFGGSVHQFPVQVCPQTDTHLDKPVYILWLNTLLRDKLGDCVTPIFICVLSRDDVGISLMIFIMIMRRRESNSTTNKNYHHASSRPGCHSAPPATVVWSKNVEQNMSKTWPFASKSAKERFPIRISGRWFFTWQNIGFGIRLLNPSEVICKSLTPA